MPTSIWLNLPVKNVAKAREFFEKIDFPFNPHHPGGDDCLSLKLGTNEFIVMLFAQPTFEGFVKTSAADTATSAEVLISVGADTRQEVDEIAAKVTAAGGNLFAKPAETDGWMYGCAFQDLDGHRWNVLYMDMSQMPQ